MANKRFELNDDTISIIEEIGGHMPGGFFIYRAEEPETLLYANKAVFDINIADCRNLQIFAFVQDDHEAKPCHPERSEWICT